ncbi:MAG: DnaJ domain-containing protein [Chloroflexota bacterium]
MAAILMTDLYVTLGLRPNASTAAIRAAYRRLARRHHPDVNHAPDAALRMVDINAAYELLGDPEKRAAYDAARAGVAAWPRAWQPAWPPMWCLTWRAAGPPAQRVLVVGAGAALLIAGLVAVGVPFGGEPHQYDAPGAARSLRPAALHRGASAMADLSVAVLRPSSHAMAIASANAAAASANAAANAAGGTLGKGTPGTASVPAARSASPVPGTPGATDASAAAESASMPDALRAPGTGPVVTRAGRAPSAVDVAGVTSEAAVGRSGPPNEATPEPDQLALAGYDRAWRVYVQALQAAAARSLPLVPSEGIDDARPSRIGLAPRPSGDAQLGMARALYLSQQLAWGQQMNGALAARAGANVHRPDSAKAAQAERRLRQAANLIHEAQASGVAAPVGLVRDLLDEADRLHRASVAEWAAFLAQPPEPIL